jgi:hypothetical protein
VRNRSLSSGTRRFQTRCTRPVGPAIGILRAWGPPVADRRLKNALIQTHRRIHSPSWRLLRASRRAAEAARVKRWYRRHRGGPNRLAPPPPVRALSEVETMWRCGFHSIRAWRRARRYGGFPEPARVSTEGPIWTERQIAVWLGEERPLAGYDYDEDVPTNDDAVSEDEAALLREIEQRTAARRMGRVA